MHTHKREERDIQYSYVYNLCPFFFYRDKWQLTTPMMRPSCIYDSTIACIITRWEWRRGTPNPRFSSFSSIKKHHYNASWYKHRTWSIKKNKNIYIYIYCIYPLWYMLYEINSLNKIKLVASKTIIPSDSFLDVS